MNKEKSDFSVTNQSATDQSETDQNVTDQSATDQSETDQSATDQSKEAIKPHAIIDNKEINNGDKQTNCFNLFSEGSIFYEIHKTAQAINDLIKPIKLLRNDFYNLFDNPITEITKSFYGLNKIFNFNCYAYKDTEDDESEIIYDVEIIDDEEIREETETEILSGLENEQTDTETYKTLEKKIINFIDKEIMLMFLYILGTEKIENIIRNNEIKAYSLFFYSITRDIREPEKINKRFKYYDKFRTTLNEFLAIRKRKKNERKATKIIFLDDLQFLYAWFNKIGIKEPLELIKLDFTKVWYKARTKRKQSTNYLY